MPTPAPTPKRLLPAWLRSQGLGVLCGQATVLLLAIGSVCIAWNRDTVYADLSLDDIDFFFDQPALMHSWFYLLLPVMTLYGVNTALCTYDSVLVKWRAGMRSPFRYGAAFIHVAFLLAGVAHLVGGLGSEEGEPILLGTAWTELGEGRAARVTGVELERYPTQMPRRIDATVEVRDARGQVASEIVGFNQPLSFGFGHDLMLFANWGVTPQVANIVGGDEACALTEGTHCTLGGHTVELHQIQQVGRGVFGAVVSVARATPDDDGATRAERPFMLTEWRPHRLQSGATLSLRSIETHPALLLRHRTAPGNPWALASAFVLALGLLLLGRRWFQ